jgi:hypothetical protein
LQQLEGSLKALEIAMEEMPNVPDSSELFRLQR